MEQIHCEGGPARRSEEGNRIHREGGHASV